MTTKNMDWLARSLPSLRRASAVLSLIGVCAYLANPTASQAQRLYSEDFEELPLGPNVDEPVAGTEVWTKTPPPGWTIDDSKMPGVGIPDRDGRTEWAGWSFADKAWWIRADDQRRSEFVFGQGTVMIADPDEWDDQAHDKGLFESIVTTAPIGITNAPANSLVLVYDSSWRPEGRDDGGDNWPVDEEGVALNNQTGFITVAYDGGATNEVQRWTSISDEPTFHDHAPNESILIPLNNPAGANNLVLRIGMERAANDWWWAVDNLAVGIPPFASGVSADGVSFTARIVEALNKSVDQSRGVVVELDGTAVSPVTLTKEGDYLLVRYTQDPAIFQPGSRHTVKLTFTSNEGTALEDTLEFVAPSYTTLSVTPTSIIANITDREWLTVDESKGVQFELDGTAVTGSAANRTDTVVNASVSPAQPFESQSSHTLNVIFTTATGQRVVDAITFTAPLVMTVPATLATDVGTGSGAGMRWRTHQLATGRGGDSIALSEQQLAGTLGASIHETPGEIDGFFPIEFVNFEQAAGEAGNFRSTAEGDLAVADLNIPGVSGLNGDDNIAAEALTFLEFAQPGVYTMGVNSDDGFQVSVGTTNNPTQVVLGRFDSGRGAADTLFHIKIDRAGVYFFRLLWFEGGGGASVEWFTVNPDGTRALVGGTQTGAIKAYRTRTVPEPSGATPGIQSVTRSGGAIQITFTGTLRSAASITGPFEPVSNATSPFTVNPTAAAAFYIAQ